MNIIGIIPARYMSTRFPGKPLININGKTMIQRVYEQAQKSELSKLLVATDDQRIFNEVISFGGQAVITSSQHLSGTDRCLEALEKLNEKFDVVINIQGDEPFIKPEQIKQVANCFLNTKTQIATLAKTINNKKELLDTNTTKVMLDNNKTALSFFRKITAKKEINTKPFFKHIGIYGYRTKVLTEITKLPQSPNEISERLEQLRWLEKGYKIKIAITDIESISIDTPEDLKKIEFLR